MSEAKIIKILLVDEHPLFIRGLASLLETKREYKIIGEASTPGDALAIAKKEKPDLVIMEINLGNESGMDLIPDMKSQNPETMIMALSMCDERFYSERVLRLGARGYVMKTEPPNKVLDAVKIILSGREQVGRAKTGENQQDGKDWTALIQKLSDRELQIFFCVGKGLGTIEIAKKYNISTKTIDTHKDHIKLKLRCSSSHELRRLAIEWASHQEAL
ncbi:MAG: response regulator transcription factor [Treponema sp.]|nr:response regulator transcription factor [Treponema sp.]